MVERFLKELGRDPKSVNLIVFKSGSGSMRKASPEEDDFLRIYVKCNRMVTIRDIQDDSGFQVIARNKLGSVFTGQR